MFGCDSNGVAINGSGSFSGNLTAESTSFNKLVAGNSWIDNSEAFFDTKFYKMNNSGNNYMYHGRLRIGKPENDWTWNDITITPYYVETDDPAELKRGDALSKSYGNLGTPDRKWDVLNVRLV